MKNPEAMSDVMEVVTNVPAISVIIPNADTKVPRARTRVVSMDRTPTSSPRRYFVRQSTDSPKPSIDITNHKRTENHAPQMSPTVKLHRLSLEAQSPKEKALSIGLDPQGLELISSMMTVATSTTGSEYSDKSDDIIGMSKMTREMKNLQKSTTDSKILSDYLSTSSESPRSRSRKTKETPIVDPDEEVEDEEEELKEASLEEELSIASVTNDGNETDSTIVLPMEPPEKRRKSVSRSRSRARSDMRGRKKSIARQMKAELSLTSDRDDDDKEDADDQMSETSFVTSQSIEGRPVNPPPKVSFYLRNFRYSFINKILFFSSVGTRSALSVTLITLCYRSRAPHVNAPIIDTACDRIRFRKMPTYLSAQSVLRYNWQRNRASTSTDTRKSTLTHSPTC